MRLVYLSHAFGGDMAKADNAERWCAFLTWHISGAFFCAPWVHLVRSGIKETPSNKARGLALDVESVQRFDGICAILDESMQLSPGQRLEYDAHPFRFLVPFSRIPEPTHPVLECVQQWVESL